MRELMCFAAVLGFERERKLPLAAKTEEIDGRTFENHEESLDIIFLIALADARDAGVLREGEEDACVAVFEQYAEGGFGELSAWLRERPDDAHGDTAMLEAMARHGFLGEVRSVDAAVHDVAF